jgi:hypothetical protein
MQLKNLNFLAPLKTMCQHFQFSSRWISDLCKTACSGSGPESAKRQHFSQRLHQLLFIYCHVSSQFASYFGPLSSLFLLFTMLYHSPCHVSTLSSFTHSASDPPPLFTTFWQIGKFQVLLYTSHHFLFGCKSSRMWVCNA